MKIAMLLHSGLFLRNTRKKLKNMQKKRTINGKEEKYGVISFIISVLPDIAFVIEVIDRIDELAKHRANTPSPR